MAAARPCSGCQDSRYLIDRHRGACRDPRRGPDNHRPGGWAFLRPRLRTLSRVPVPAGRKLRGCLTAVPESHSSSADGQAADRPPHAIAGHAGDVLDADGYLLGTPANIGYMSGALKHFFDTIYYPCLVATERRPYALYVHGDNDAAGAAGAAEAIAPGLKWRRPRPPVCVTGRPGAGDLEACWELGATLAAELSA